LSYLSEIETRHADRRAFIFDYNGKTAKPSPYLDDAIKDHVKEIKESQPTLLEKCFLVDHDMQVLLVGFRQMAQDTGKDLEKYVKEAWERTPMDENAQTAKWVQEVKAAEEREKEAKKNGEVPGQTKMFKDDGSVAEEATPVSTKKTEAAAK